MARLTAPQTTQPQLGGAGRGAAPAPAPGAGAAGGRWLPAPVCQCGQRSAMATAASAACQAVTAVSCLTPHAWPQWLSRSGAGCVVYTWMCVHHPCTICVRLRECTTSQPSRLGAATCTCRPQPDQVGRPHSPQLVCRHITCPVRAGSAAGPAAGPPRPGHARAGPARTQGERPPGSQSRILKGYRYLFLYSLLFSIRSMY
jgi:hypothetical protein